MAVKGFLKWPDKRLRSRAHEIAEITETSIGTVKSRLFYTTKKLSKSLQFLNAKV